MNPFWFPLCLHVERIHKFSLYKNYFSTLYTCGLIISLAVVPKEKTRTPKNKRSKQKHPKKYPHQENKKQQKAVIQLHTCIYHTIYTLSLRFFFKVKFQSAVSYPLNKTMCYCKFKNLWISLKPREAPNKATQTVLIQQKDWTLNRSVFKMLFPDPKLVLCQIFSILFKTVAKQWDIILQCWFYQFCPDHKTEITSQFLSL